MGFSSGQMSQPSMSTAAEESSALTKVMWFAIIQLVGMVSVWVIGFYIFYSVFFNTHFFSSLPTNATPAQVSAALGPLFTDLTLLVPVALGIYLVGLFVLLLAFRGLARVDHARFGTSTAFMLVLIVGVLLIAGGVIPLFYNIPNMISNAPTSGIPSNAFFNSMGTVFAYIGILLVGGLLGLIGLIGGLILGLWRVGGRYNQTTIKVGAIFEIIPLLQVIAPILILLGANDAKGSLTR